MSWSRVLLSVLGVAAAFAATAVSAQEVDKAAEVNGSPIMAAELDAKLGNDLAQLQQQIFNLRQKQLNTMIDQKLLEEESAKRGVLIAALVQSEVTSHVKAATPEDAEKFFKENSTKLKGDYKSLEEQIKTFLTAQRLQARQQEFLKSLRAAAKVEVFLTPPPVFRSEVGVEGAPVRGSASAPVTIVEFSDFHCPFCRKAQPVLEELRAKYGAKVKFVFRDFPLDNLHPQARAAAEASRCANEQGKFWELHDRLFQSDTDSSPATLNRIAKEIGMDVAAFEACSSSGKYKTSVQASTQEGVRLGITGTPTFFVNGRMMVGAQPLDAFVRIIEEELAAAAPRSGQRAALKAGLPTAPYFTVAALMGANSLRQELLGLPAHATDWRESYGSKWTGREAYPTLLAGAFGSGGTKLRELSLLVAAEWSLIEFRRGHLLRQDSRLAYGPRLHSGGVSACQTQSQVGKHGGITGEADA